MGFWWNKRGKRLLSISSQMSHNLRVWALKKRVMVCGGLLRPEWKRRLMMAISIHNVMLSVLLWWKWILLENKVWYDYLQQALWWSLAKKFLKRKWILFIHQKGIEIVKLIKSDSRQYKKNYISNKCFYFFLLFIDQQIMKKVSRFPQTY